MKVQISDNLDPVTKENMMDMTFTTSVMAADGTTETGTCTLGDIASWTTGTAPDSITSENQTRYITVTADTLDGYNTTVQSRVLQKTLDAFALTDEMPEGCSFYMGGGSEINGMVVDQMGQWMFLALPFVYLVMVAQFQSLLSPFIVLFTIPLAFTGTFLALWLTGTPLSIIALIGAIMLVGIVTKNGIVLVDYTNLLVERGSSVFDAVVAGGKSRLRPVLMTSFTTILGMLPLALGTGEGSETWQPMGIAVIGGLTCSTLLTLLVVPVLYSVFVNRRIRKAQQKQAAARQVSLNA